MAPQMGLIGFYIAQGYKIAYMALLGPFWPVGILLKRYNEVILSCERNGRDLGCRFGTLRNLPAWHCVNEELF